MSVNLFDEDVQTYDARIVRRLGAYLRPHRRLLGLGVILVLGITGLEILGPMIVRYAIDQQIARGQLDQLGLIVVVYGASLVGLFGLHYLQTMLMTSVGQRVMMALGRDLFTHLQRLSVAYFDRHPVGWLVTRATNDIATLETIISQGVVESMTNILLISVILVVLILLDWRLALAMLVLLAILTVAVVHIAARQRQGFRAQRAWLSRINAYLNENLTGIAVVQLFNRQAENLRRFDDRNRGLLRANLAVVSTFAIFEPTVVLFNALAVGVILWYGGGQVVQDALSLGTLVAFMQYMQRFYWPIRELADRYNTVQQALASSERIFRVLDEPVDIKDPDRSRPLESGASAVPAVWSESGVSVPPRAGERTNATAVPGAPVMLSDSEASVPATSGDRTSGERMLRLRPQHDNSRLHDNAPLLPPFQGKIEFRNVWFSYDPGNWVLSDVSLRIEPGEKVAVVGATGAGKSTLMSLLCRFYDVQRGAILLDDVPIKEMAQADLRRRVRLILQDPFLFTDTILENVRMRDPSIGSERAVAAAALVGADTFIAQLPQGWDTVLAERGANLSVGQKQLLALTRAAAFDPEVVLVLDEATASVDPLTDELIQTSLRRVLHGRTALIIAHRLNTIHDVDRIVVLHHGRVVEEGTHAALLAQHGAYARLYEMQYVGQLPG